MYEERVNGMSTLNINATSSGFTQQYNSQQQQHQQLYYTEANKGNQLQNQHHHNNHLQEINFNRRMTNRGVEDTGSIISDYTEDDIDLPDELNQQVDGEMDVHNLGTTPNHQQRLNTASARLDEYGDFGAVAEQVESERMKTVLSRERSPRVSVGKKRNQRQSSSLTRNPEPHDQKRTRTRSSDMQQQQKQQIEQQQKPTTQSGSAIMAITTLRIGDDGKPIELSSEIKHSDATSTVTRRQINANLSKKRRPSREFLQRSAEDSDSTDDSKIFWNGSEEAVAEAVSEQKVAQTGGTVGGSISGMFNTPTNPHQVHIMTPIVEAVTPAPKFAEGKQPMQNATPLKFNSVKNVNTGVLGSGGSATPLARRYKKPHSFNKQAILNSELCAHCDKRTKFGKMVMKCKECELVVHAECKDLIQMPCLSLANYPASGQGCIADYVSNSRPPYIPAVLQLLVNEIELRGLVSHEVGLYRVNGSDIQIKSLKEKLLKRHKLPNLRKINDVHVLCSFVKEFLNTLSEHLITYDAWHRFAKIVEVGNENERVRRLQEAVYDLPEPNRDSLAFLVLHLQRIADTPECKMPASNLARVFGPSIVGNSSPNLAAAEIINELKIQQQLVENLIKLSSDFYLQFVEPNNASEQFAFQRQQQQQQQQQQPQPPQQHLLFKNYGKTPESLRKSKTAVVLSSILGPAMNLTAQPPSAASPALPNSHMQLHQQQMQSIRNTYYNSNKNK
jgi:hypothetical protein